jgi:hypothetical protein
MILAVYTQLRLAGPLAADMRRPWEKPAPPQWLTAARVRRGFRHLRQDPQSCPGAQTVPARTGTPTRPPQQSPHPTPRRTHRHRADQRENDHEETENGEIR